MPILRLLLLSEAIIGIINTKGNYFCQGEIFDIGEKEIFGIRQKEIFDIGKKGESRLLPSIIDLRL